MQLATKERLWDCGERQLTGRKDPNEAVMEKLSMMAGSVGVASDQESPINGYDKLKEKNTPWAYESGGRRRFTDWQPGNQSWKEQDTFLTGTKLVTIHLKQNNLINTSVQKVWAFQDTWNTQVWFGIRTKLQMKGRDWHILFVDLVNAFAAVPHSLWAPFEFFHIPATITHLVRNYFQDLQFDLITAEHTTSWQSVGMGIMAGCSPLKRNWSSVHPNG